MSKIEQLKAIEILDSRGVPTLKVKLKTNFGIFEASVPSGTSVGKNEAKEIRDKKKRFFGKGVQKAVKIVEKIISPKLKGEDPSNQKKIDQILISLDGKEDKSSLGVNSILAVSIATLRAGAAKKNLSLFEYISNLFGKKISKKKIKIPTPLVLLIEGGKHANGLLDIQEFLLVPEGKNFEKKIQIGSEIYYQLGEILKRKYGKLSSNVGLEGGFVPPINKTEKALELILQAARERNYSSKIKIGLDIAASHFYKKNTYFFEDSIFTFKGMIDFYLKISSIYPIFSIEDPFSEDDFEGWGKMLQKIKENKKEILIVGDDLTVSNPKLIKIAYQKNLCNGIILKPNQIGTISEILEAAKLAKTFGWKIIVSHRSGETCDDFISDLAVAIGADFIKTGAPRGGERVSKYNRLLEIENRF